MEKRIKNRKIALLILLLVVFLFAIASYLIKSNNTPMNNVEISGRFIYFDSITKLHEDADLIIIGSPTEAFEKREHITTKYEDGNVQDFYTKTNITIEKIIKQPASLNLTPETDFKIIEPVGIINEKDGKKPNSFIRITLSLKRIVVTLCF